MEPFKVITIRAWYPSSSQYVPIRDNSGLGRNLDLLSTWPRIERAEYNLQTEAGQFPERAYELLNKINIDAKRYRFPLVYILQSYEDLIRKYQSSPYFKTIEKIHG